METYLKAIQTFTLMVIAYLLYHISVDTKDFVDLMFQLYLGPVQVQ